MFANFAIFCCSFPNKFALDSHITKYFHGRPQFSSIPLAAICCYQTNEKKKKKSTDFDCSSLSDLQQQAHWLWEKKSFLMLKIFQTLFASV